MCPFDYKVVAGSGKVWPVNQVNHTSWVAVVIPTDRPKSVRNRCVIELFCGVVCVVTLPLWHFCWCMGFCHTCRTESDIFLFLLFIIPFLNQTFTRFYVFFNLAYFHAILCSIMQWSTKSVCILCNLHVNRLSNVFKFERLKNFQEGGGGGGVRICTHACTCMGTHIQPFL